MKSRKANPMQHTVFDTPVVNILLRWLALLLLKVTGWRKAGVLPAEPKYVMIAAPHTSNWDLPVMLMLAFVLGARVFWMGKDALFRRPFGTLFRWLGGIPVDRSKSNNAVEQAIQNFRDRESFVLLVAPEGTRKRVTHWKTGFYHIARGAGVPIVLGFLDYRRKVGGIGPVITPSGGIEADMDTIRQFYADITGKREDGIVDLSQSRR
jgi:1-acyl-sn-glycerol-3-phosphate acyltransferase